MNNIEIKLKFITSLIGIVDFWGDSQRPFSLNQRIRGLALSVLKLIDGEDPTMLGMKLQLPDPTLQLKNENDLSLNELFLLLNPSERTSFQEIESRQREVYLEKVLLNRDIHDIEIKDITAAIKTVSDNNKKIKDSIELTPGVDGVNWYVSEDMLSDIATYLNVDIEDNVVYSVIKSIYDDTIGK